MILKRAFTLFLCAIMIFFIFYAPSFFKENKVDYNKHYKDMEKDIPWRGVITVWDFPRLDTSNGSRYGWIRRKIREFEKKNPGVYIDLRELDWSNGPTLLKAAAKTGAYPDIAPVGSDFYFISKAVLEELDTYISSEEKADFTDNAINSVTYNGRMYGLPWMTTGYALLLNTDMFTERSVALPEGGNWTYEEFLVALKALTYDTNGKGGPDVYGFNSFIEPGYYNAYGIIMSDGAQFVNRENGEYCFDYPEALSGLRKLWDLKHTYNVAHPEFGKMNENEAWTSFLKKKAAVYTAGSWAIPYLRNIQHIHELNFTVANFPTGNAEIPITISSNICSYGVFKQENDKKREKCIEFIKHLTAKENQQELASFGYFPVRKSGSNLYRNDKEMYIIQQSLGYAEPLPKLYNWDEIDLVLQSRIKSAIMGELTPEQALSDAKVLVERYMHER